VHGVWPPGVTGLLRSFFAEPFQCAKIRLSEEFGKLLKPEDIFRRVRIAAGLPIAMIRLMV
jgi:hypothetical protein